MKDEIDPTDLEENAARATSLLKSMANERRLLILCHLADGPKTVGELVDLVGLGQSALSQHLAIMRREQLVATMRSGQSVSYSLSSREVEAVLMTLYDLYCGPDSATASTQAREPETV